MKERWRRSYDYILYTSLSENEGGRRERHCLKLVREGGDVFIG